MAADDERYKTRPVSSTTKRRAVTTMLSRQPRSLRITSGQRAAIVGATRKS